MAKAQTELKADHYDKAIGADAAPLAFRIAKDPDAFLQLAWVKDMTAKVAARAADLEKAGKWLESLSLYTDLNTLYEVDTRYKADMQRLNRRTRLLAVYTPKALLDMRQAMADELGTQRQRRAGDEAGAGHGSGDDAGRRGRGKYRNQTRQIEPLLAEMAGLRVAGPTEHITPEMMAAAIEQAAAKMGGGDDLSGVDAGGGGRVAADADDAGVGDEVQGIWEGGDEGEVGRGVERGAWRRSSRQDQRGAGARNRGGACCWRAGAIALPSRWW